MKHGSTRVGMRPCFAPRHRPARRTISNPAIAGGVGDCRVWHQNPALGRSRGGFTTKIHARTNAEGRAVALILSQGEAHDRTAFDALIAKHSVKPQVSLADNGHARDDIRGNRRARGAKRTKFERFFNRHTQSRRVATRYDRTALSFLGFAKPAANEFRIRLAHAA